MPQVPPAPPVGLVAAPPPRQTEVGSKAALMADLNMGQVGTGATAFQAIRRRQMANTNHGTHDPHLRKQLLGLGADNDGEDVMENYDRWAHVQPKVSSSMHTELLKSTSIDDVVETLWFTGRGQDPKHVALQQLNTEGPERPLGRQLATLRTFVDVLDRKLTERVPGHQAGVMQFGERDVLSAAWELPKFVAAWNNGTFANASGPGAEQLRTDVGHLLAAPDKLDAAGIERISETIVSFAGTTAHVQDPEMRWDPDMRLASVHVDDEGVITPVYDWRRPTAETTDRHEAVALRDLYRHGLRNIEAALKQASPQEVEAGIAGTFADTAKVDKVIASRAKGELTSGTLDQAMEGPLAIGPDEFALYLGGPGAPAATDENQTAVRHAFEEVAGKNGLTASQLQSIARATVQRLSANPDKKPVKDWLGGSSDTATPAQLLGKIGMRLGPDLPITPGHATKGLRVDGGAHAAVIVHDDDSVSIIGDAVEALDDIFRVATPVRLTSKKDMPVWTRGFARQVDLVDRLEDNARAQGEPFKVFIHPDGSDPWVTEPGNRLAVRGLNPTSEQAVYEILQNVGIEGVTARSMGDHLTSTLETEKTPTRGFVIELGPADRNDVGRLTGLIDKFGKQKNLDLDMALHVHGPVAPTGFERVWEHHFTDPKGQRLSYRTAARPDTATPNETPVWVPAGEAAKLSTKRWPLAQRMATEQNIVPASGEFNAPDGIVNQQVGVLWAGRKQLSKGPAVVWAQEGRLPVIAFGPEDTALAALTERFDQMDPAQVAVVNVGDDHVTIRTRASLFDETKGDALFAHRVADVLAQAGLDRTSRSIELRGEQ